jgi:hypothetical protein
VLPIVQSGTTKKTSIESVLTSVQPSGTANGVTYLNGSKVLTSGSALTFDGTNLGVGTASPSFGDGYSGIQINSNTGSTLKLTNSTTGTSSTDGFELILGNGNSDAYVWQRENAPLIFGVNSAEQMRLTSTGLGIGTSSPGAKLDVSTGSTNRLRVAENSNQLIFDSLNSAASAWGAKVERATSLAWWTATSGEPSTGMTLNGSGNLGLGVTPSAWDTFKVLQVGNSSLHSLTTGNNSGVTSNAYFQGGWKYVASSSATYYQQFNGQHLWFNAASGTAGDAISFTQAMTLDADGDLGIGETSPAVKLHTKFSSNTAYSATAQSPNAVWFVNDSTTTNAYTGIGLTVGASGSATVLLNAIRTADFETAFAITTRGSGGTYAERARIDSDGNLLVGVTSDTGSPNNGVTIRNSTGGTLGNIGIGHASGVGSGNAYMAFAYAGTQIGSITQSGTTAVLYNITSDQRLKENIQDAAPASALIDALQVRQYDWKADGNHQRYGFVAQELLAVAPEAVHQPADPEAMMAVDYSKLVPMLVKEIQSLRARVAQLESK